MSQPAQVTEKAQDRGTKTVNLALQGGGAHGAFAWGVLDKLLEDGRLDIEGICATSAGSMNACAYAYGLHIGGREGAREKLEEFWYKIHKAGEAFKFFQSKPWDNMFNMPRWTPVDDALHMITSAIIRTFSPYEWNPFNINPLNDVLQDVINFDDLHTDTKTKLFISTTHVETGRVRIFHNKNVTHEVVMASACLPLLFQAVEIDGETYWDGGYMGNPALFPIFNQTQSRDLIIVHLNTIDRKETPKTAPDIVNRINEISFNAALFKEMRAIAFVKKLKEHGMLKESFDATFKDLLVHSVRAHTAMYDLSESSRLSSEWSFLTKLRDHGREAMQNWLDQHYDDVGQRDTVDMHSEFVSSITQQMEQEKP